MKNITVIIVGTTHETTEEKTLFKILNNIIKENKNIHWLCEGESDKRECTSIKDYRIHLLTDALFVNMMILDFQNNKLSDKYVKEFYNRIIELLITISRVEKENGITIQFNNILPLDYQHLVDQLKNEYPISNHTMEIIFNILKGKENKLFSELREIISKIVRHIVDSNTVDKSYHECILKFFKDGYSCEDKIMLSLREKSFIELILYKLSTLYNEKDKQYVIVTVGNYHIKPLKIILEKFGVNVQVLDI